MSTKEELLEEVEEIEITTREILHALYVGERESKEKGVGFEFEEFRDYLPGEDDPKKIDWFASVKMPGRTLVREFIEEKQLNVFLVVDISDSMFFGKETKRDKAFKICATLAFSALKFGDQVGFLSFTDRVEQFAYPKRGKKQVFYILSDLIWRKRKGKTTDLKAPWDKLLTMKGRSNLVFLISDFPNNEGLDFLRNVIAYCDLIPIVIKDSLEYRLPPGQIVLFKGLEGGWKKFHLTESNCQKLRKKQEEARHRRKKVFQDLGLSFVEIEGRFRDYVQELIRIFSSRRIERC